MITEVAERLIGRALCSGDGCTDEEVADAEARLNVSLPPALRELYLRVGRIRPLMDSFQQFIKLDELSVVNGKLCFLEENQTVCFWGCGTGEDDPVVYQTDWVQDEDGNRFPKGDYFSEGVGLAEFLKIILYYQMAQCGYEYSGICGPFDCEGVLPPEWEKVVEHRGLVIWWREDGLIWYFPGSDGTVAVDSLADGIFLSARTEAAFAELSEEYGFDEF